MRYRFSQNSAERATVHVTSGTTVLRLGKDRVISHNTGYVLPVGRGVDPGGLGVLT